MLKKLIILFFSLGLLACAANKIKKEEICTNPNWKVWEIIEVDNSKITFQSENGAIKKYPLKKSEIVFFLLLFEVNSLEEIVGYGIECECPKDYLDAWIEMHLGDEWCCDAI